MARRVVATGDGGARSTPKAFEAWHSRGPAYTEMTETAPGLVHTPVAGTTNWYPPAMIGAAGLGNKILRPDTVAKAGSLLAALTPDDYSIFLENFYADGCDGSGRIGATLTS